MALAVANARDEDNQPVFKVIGVDLPTEDGQEKVRRLNEGVFPVQCNDPKIPAALDRALETGNFYATTDASVYGLADIVIVDIHLSLSEHGREADIEWGGFHAAMEMLGEYMKPGSLILVETTVPPGTCQKVVGPIIEKQVQARGLPPKAIHIAHSYERVMPGDEYFDSITDFWRVFSGIDEESADLAEAFLRKIINTQDFPLRRLHSTTASETAKVLENSYRAVTIAFMQEWTEFAEMAGVDLFQVIEAIRDRPTHSNIRQPGFGVGGYCLTKDPLFALLTTRNLFENQNLQFPFCELGVATNQRMPMHSLSILREELGGLLQGKQILLMGVSYRPDVGDTRYSPSELFARQVIEEGGEVVFQDPIVEHWIEMECEVPSNLPELKAMDAVVLAVPHREYASLDFQQWIVGDRLTVIIDANRVLNDQQQADIEQKQVTLRTIGKG